MKTFHAARGNPLWLRVQLAALAVLVLVCVVPVVGLLAGTQRLAYTIEPELVTVEATIAGVGVGGGQWPRTALTGAEVVELQGSPQRVGGTALPHFCAGRWRLPDGRSASLATTCESAVVVMTFGAETVVVSPAEPVAFVEALRKEGSTVRVEPPISAEGAGPMLFVLGPTLLVALLLPLLLGVWLPRKVRALAYSVGEGRLTVPAHLRPVVVPLAGVKARRQALTGAFRMAGTGLPGVLHLGRYRGGGRWLHCAASNLSTGWLIESEPPVYVTPEDNEAFAQALREAGAVVE